MEIPKTIKENIILRLNIENDCQKSDDKKLAAYTLCKKNVLNFFNLFLSTYDTRKTPADRPFILYPFQEDFVIKINEAIKTGIDYLSEKTRDMGCTWMVLGIFLYRWLFFNENFLVGSKVESSVDTIGNMQSHFERMRYMLKRLPDWVLSMCEFSMKNSAFMKLFKENGASITGESMNDNFSRQGRYNAILLDEFAFVEQAEKIFQACGDSTPCRLPVSTPNGKHNAFARIRDSGKIKIATLHWRQHPEKTDEWYKIQCKRRTDKEVAQELDINYTVSAGRPFYGGFSRGLHCGHFNIGKKELILGWDYGYVHPSCVITTIDSKSRWVILDNLFGERELIEEFGNKVKTFLNQQYPGYEITSYGDPAGNQESDKSKKTSTQILGELGFNVYSRPSNTSLANYTARKAIIEGKIKLLIDGLPALLIEDNLRNQIIIEGFEGGYHYPEANKYGFIDEKPLKEGYYEHPFNALEYIAVNLFSPIPESKADKGELTYKTVGPLKDVHWNIDDYDDEYRPRDRYRNASRGVMVD